MSSLLSFLLVAAVIALIFVIVRGGNNQATNTNNSNVLAVIGLVLTCFIPIVGFVIAIRELFANNQIYIKVFSILALAINIGVSIAILWPILIYVI